jgi:hypothetical protein
LTKLIGIFVEIFRGVAFISGIVISFVVLETNSVIAASLSRQDIWGVGDGWGRSWAENHPQKYQFV